jgi:hypothetical protein
MQAVPSWRMRLVLAWFCPRCGARTRSGNPCRSPTMANGRCRMHGGKSTGPRTAGGLMPLRQARTINGGRSAEMIKLRRQMVVGAKLRRAIIKAIE